MHSGNSWISFGINSFLSFRPILRFPSLCRAAGEEEEEEAEEAEAEAEAEEEEEEEDEDQM